MAIRDCIRPSRFMILPCCALWVCSACGTTSEDMAQGEGLSLRSALTTMPEEMETDWIHKHRVELYEQIAVNGALQASDRLSDPLLTGSGLLHSPVDQLDQARESQKKLPLLYPDIRKDEEGNVGLFQASLPEELCWPAEYAYGLQEVDDRETVDEALPAVGFSSEPEDLLIERSQEDVIEDLSPWLQAVAEWAGIPDATVHAAPSRPFLLAIDREEQHLYLNPSFLPVIVAAASNQNRHVQSAMPTVYVTDTRSPRDNSYAEVDRETAVSRSNTMVKTSVPSPRMDDVETPDRFDQIMADYQQFATSNPPAYVSSAVEFSGDPDTACSCASETCDWGACYTETGDCENACAYGCDDGLCEGYAVWCNEDTSDDPTCEEDCSQSGKASAGHAARSLLLFLLPVLLFWQWGRRPRNGSNVR